MDYKTKRRWVVLSFHQDGTYNTTTFETIEDATDYYDLCQKTRNSDFAKGCRYALILEGSELPIKGYKAGEMVLGGSYEEIK